MEAAQATRVLIVDDSVQVLQDLRTILPLAGRIEIVGEAANGLEAVHQVEVLLPEVVLMDLAMPLMDGYEAARQIKARWPGCRIIALTVNDYPAARQEALQAGIDEFVVKGTAIENLAAVISKT